MTFIRNGTTRANPEITHKKIFETNGMVRSESISGLVL